MTERRWWRLTALALVAIAAGLLAAFNVGERVALNLGFTMLYRVPLVPLIFLVFMAGMTTMFLVGLRHDARVRRALRDAGLGEPMSEGSRRGESRARRPGSPPEATHDSGSAPSPEGERLRRPEAPSSPPEADPWERPRSPEVEVTRDGPSTAWAEARPTAQPPEPLPPDQEPRDPP